MAGPTQRWRECQKIVAILNNANTEPLTYIFDKANVYAAYKLLEPFVAGILIKNPAAIAAGLDVMKRGNYYGSPTNKPKRKTVEERLKTERLEINPGSKPTDFKLKDNKQQQSLFAEFEGYKTEKSKRKAISIMMWAFKEIDDAELTGKAFEAVKLLHSPRAS